MGDEEVLEAIMEAERIRKVALKLGVPGNRLELVYLVVLQVLLGKLAPIIINNPKGRSRK